MALLYGYYPLTWRIIWLTFYYCYCSCFLFLFVYCYGKMQFFIHCNFFCQEYNFTYFTYYWHIKYITYSVASSGWSLVIADHLGLFVGQNRCGSCGSSLVSLIISLFLLLYSVCFTLMFYYYSICSLSINCHLLESSI